VFPITTSARTPSVSRFPMGFMTSPKTVALLSWAFPTTLPHSRSCHRPLEVPGRFPALLRLTPDSHSGRYRRLQRLSLLCLEDRAPVSTGQLFCPVCHRGPLSSRRFQMEPHRASSFFEVSRNWAGEPLDSYQKILNYKRTTKTQTGLTVTAYLDRRNYPCGLKPTPAIAAP